MLSCQRSFLEVNTDLALTMCQALLEVSRRILTASLAGKYSYYPRLTGEETLTEL